MAPAEKIAEALKIRQNILLLNHVSPDGDSLGSTLALARVLRRRGQAAIVGSADGVPEMYRFLPGSEQVRTEIPSEDRFDAVVFMECSSPERAGALAARAAGVPLCVNIDHHLSNSGYGDLMLWDVDAAAVAEVVFPIITALQPALDRETAECLMTALLTDTGSFRYPSVTPRSFELAAVLARAGASPTTIYSRVYEDRPAASVRLLGLALSRMVVCEGGRVAWTTVTQEMLQEVGTTMEEAEGIVGALRGIRGIQAAALFKVEPDGIRVSLRGVGGLRANVIAEMFGGGGHAAAAGFTAHAPLDDVIRDTLAAIRRELGAAAR